MAILGFIVACALGLLFFVMGVIILFLSPYYDGILGAGLISLAVGLLVLYLSLSNAPFMLVLI